MTLRALFGALRGRFWLLLRYGVAGAFGALIQTSVLYVWVSMLGFANTYLVGAFLGFCAALAVTFLLQKYWTFRDHTTHQTRRQLIGYSIVAVINVTLNIVLLALAKELLSSLGVDFFQGWYMVAQTCIVVLASGISFILNYFFTFRSDPDRVKEAFESSPFV